MTSIPPESEFFPVTVPELDDRSQPLQLIQWLVDPGAQVFAGGRIAELLVAGVVFHLAAPVDGVLQRLAVSDHSPVHIGDVLAWIRPHTDGN